MLITGPIFIGASALRLGSAYRGTFSYYFRKTYGHLSLPYKRRVLAQNQERLELQEEQLEVSNVLVDALEACSIKVTPFFLSNLREDIDRIKADPVLSGLAQFFYLESLIHRRGEGNRELGYQEADALEEIIVIP